MKKNLSFLILLFAFACTPKDSPINDVTEAPPCEYVEYRPQNLALCDGSTFSPQSLFEALQVRRIEYPEVFTQIAIQECGWELDPVYRNNFFGFACNPNSRFVCGCKGEFSEFETPEHAFAFLREWIAYDPPKGDINAYEWLQRRGYNPDPVYYERIKAHDFWNKID